MEDYSDATLILIGHGATVNAESAEPTYQHADEIRRRGLFADVVECFWKQEPAISGVMRGVSTPRAFAAPLFISEGYFTEEVIPRELGFSLDKDHAFNRAIQHGPTQLFYCGPIGTHQSMTDALRRRALSIVDRHPFPMRPKDQDITLFIAGHGTGNNTKSRKAIEDQVDILKQEGRFADAHAVFMEEAPELKEVYTLAHTKYAVVVPFFISDGLHSYEDIPVLLGEPERVVRQRFEAGEPTWRNPTERDGKIVWYSESIGNEPFVADVILERVREASEAVATPAA